MSFLLLLLCFPLGAWSLSASSSSASASSASSSSEYTQDVYWDQYSAVERLDQAAYESPKFWADLTDALPGWETRPEYQRFRGFCQNLKTKRPGETTTFKNGQQLLTQYMFPGIDDSTETPRTAYPAPHYKELLKLQQRLQTLVAPIARKEFEKLLLDKPLVNDDEQFQGEANDGDSWQRAAWYGWQYMSMRGAKKSMPKTTTALKKAMRGMGPAHRFVGLARQKANCRGVDHSDSRNYMLSTLTPVLTPPKDCGIIVNGEEATISTDGPVIILDNTFLHHVYNWDKHQDRFCLMAECWHPALTATERDALATLFAVKDRFTVVDLALAPWGYDDDDLEAALKTGAVHDLDFWKEIGYNFQKKSSNTAAPGMAGTNNSKKKKKKQQQTNKGFGGAAKPQGFGKK